MMICHEINSFELLFLHRRWDAGELQFHWHEKLEILRCAKGSFDALIDGVHYMVSPGDVVVIGAQIVHRFHILTDDTEVQLWQLSLASLMQMGIVPVPIRPVIPASAIADDARFSGRFMYLIDMFEHEGEFTTDAKNPFLQSLFASLYTALMESFHCGTGDVHAAQDKQAFYRIVDYINAHYTEPVTVQKIAQVLYMDRGLVSRLFLKYAGVTVGQYVTQLRLQRASALLGAGASVTGAALDSGFQSVRTFHDAYKKKMQETPSKAKK